MTDTIAEPPVTAEFRWAPIPESLLYDGAVTPLAVRVYGVLIRHGMTPDSCWPSHRRIADLIGVSVRSVQRPLRELEEAGWVTRHRRHAADGRELSSAYTVHAEPVDRAPERGGRAPERDTGRAVERGGVALSRATNESKGNESKKNENARALDVAERGDDTDLPAVVAEGGHLDDARDLCVEFAGAVEANGFRVAPGAAGSKAWVRAMEALLRIDGRTPDEVRRVIAWLRDSPDDVAEFWRPNVRSPAKLRSKWDTMAGQYRREKNRASGGSRQARHLQVVTGGAGLDDLLAAAEQAERANALECHPSVAIPEQGAQHDR